MSTIQALIIHSLRKLKRSNTLLWGGGARGGGGGEWRGSYFPGDTSGKESPCQYRRHKRHGFDS